MKGFTRIVEKRLRFDSTAGEVVDGIINWRKRSNNILARPNLRCCSLSAYPYYIIGHPLYHISYRWRCAGRTNSPCAIRSHGSRGVLIILLLLLVLEECASFANSSVHNKFAHTTTIIPPPRVSAVISRNWRAGGYTSSSSPWLCVGRSCRSSPVERYSTHSLRVANFIFFRE